MPLVATVILYLLAALLVSVFARWIARGLLMVSRLLPSQHTPSPSTGGRRLRA